jgi:hypothetical protein
VDETNVPSRRDPLQSQRSGPLKRERDLAAEHFYTISTDTHIDDMVILPGVFSGGANEDATGTVHFEPLLDQNLFVAGGNAVRHHPGGATSGGGTGGGIVSIVKNHAGMETGLGIYGLAANEIKEFSATPRKIFGGTIEIKTELLEVFSERSGTMV